MLQPAGATSSLGIALGAFGVVYVVVVLAAGNDPPGFLLDAVPNGPLRRLLLPKNPRAARVYTAPQAQDGLSHRISGCLLWIHVAVSYAFNSQALSSSICAWNCNLVMACLL